MEQRPSIRFGILLVLCVAIESIVSLWVLGLSSAPMMGGGDSIGYHQLSLNILDHFSFSFSKTEPFEPTMWKPPGYPVFLAVIYSVTRSVLAVRIVQFMLLAGTAWLLYLLALRFVERKAAAIAAFLCATYPPFVFQAALHLTETLSTFLTVLFVLLVVDILTHPQKRLRNSIFAGIIAGANAMVRPSLLLLIVFPLLACIWPQKILSGRRRIAISAGIIAGFLLLIGPWTVRNYMVSHRVIPIRTGNAWSLFTSSQQYANEVSYKLTSDEWKYILADYDKRLDQARNLIAVQPDESTISNKIRQELLVQHSFSTGARQKFRTLSATQILGGIPYRVAYLWSTGDTSPWAASGLWHRLVQIQYICLCLLISMGFWLCRRNVLALWPLWSVPLYLTLMHLVFHVETRFSFPARPFLLIYAGVALARLFSMVLQRKSPKGTIEPAISLA